MQHFSTQEKRFCAQNIDESDEKGGVCDMNGTIETKGLAGLADQLQHEYLAAKKCMVYQQQMEDQQLGQLCGTLAGKHRARYERMLGYLKSNG